MNAANHFRSEAKTVRAGLFRRAFFFIALFFLAASHPPAHASAEYSLNPAPDWVTPLPFEEPAAIPEESISDGVYYLLSDGQVRIRGEEVSYYYHCAWKLINRNGVENGAQISVDFDPSYESLTLHAIRVHRGGTPVDQLRPDKITVLQREPELEYRIYDGAKTANVILDDVRVGDVIEYSYTIQGQNPIFDNRYFGAIDIQWAVPVHQVRHRLLWPDGRKLFIKNHGASLRPTIKELPGFREYGWSIDDTAPLISEGELPNWYNPYSWVQLSEMESWEEVSRWALRLYEAPSTLSADLEAQIRSIAAISSDPKERAAAVLRFLQDEIRYMGIEIGAGSHAPSDPSLVLQRRFGDCKDKTFLGLTMLRELGIRAHPALVNKGLRKGLADLHPTPTAFNHVILQVVLDGTTYWLDPTLTYQRGYLDRLYQPDYGLALPLTESTADLARMKAPKPSTTTKSIQEIFDLRQGVGKEALYTIRTTYTSREADNTRRFLASESRQEIQKRYLNYYAGRFPSILLKEAMEVDDDERNNRLTVTEHYAIPEIWRHNDEESTLEAYFYPQELSEHLKAPETCLRSMPLGVSFPVAIKQTTEVLLPEDWDIETGHDQVKDPAFQFDMHVGYADKKLTLRHEYKTLNDFVGASNTANYLKSLNRVKDLLVFTVYIEDEGAPGTKTSNNGPNWSTIVLGLTVAVLVLRPSLKSQRVNATSAKGGTPSHPPTPEALPPADSCGSPRIGSAFTRPEDET